MDERTQFGHWDGDLVQFRKVYGKAYFMSMVERMSSFTVILKYPNKTSNHVIGKIADVFATLSLSARRSITFDRGSEYIDWRHLLATAGVQTWFCEPLSLWQNGSVENANKRIR